MRRSLALVIALLVGCTDKSSPSDDTSDPAADDTGDGAGDDTGEDPVLSGTETVSTSWDVDMFTLYESPTIPRFDTLGGQRQLDGMTIAVEHSAVMTIEVENGGPALSADDYAFQFFFQTIMQLGTVDDEGPVDDNEGPPFFGPGAFGATVAVDLPEGDQDPETPGEVHTETFTDEITFEAHYDPVETPTYLEAMVGEEPITVVVGGFSETWVEWHDEHGGEAYLYGGATALQYAGTMTVTYEFSPAGE